VFIEVQVNDKMCSPSVALAEGSHLAWAARWMTFTRHCSVAETTGRAMSSNSRTIERPEGSTDAERPKAYSYVRFAGHVGPFW
jgi:hypothetical protein